MKTTETSLQNAQKTSKLTLRGYYEALPAANAPKSDFVRTVAALCGVAELTVRNWIFRGMVPDRKEHIAILVEETGIPAEDLWPGRDVRL